MGWLLCKKIQAAVFVGKKDRTLYWTENVVDMLEKISLFAFLNDKCCSLAV